MGLDINNYTILDGAVELTGLYGHARDIRINKEDNKFIVECLFYVFKDINGTLKRIDTLFMRKEYAEDFLTKTWTDVYNLVKEKLDAMGITYTDNI